VIKMKRLKNLILGVLVLLVVCGCELTVDELIEQLKRGYISKEEAVDALVKIGTPAVGPLIAALGDENWLVREAATSALEKINPNWHTTEEAKRQVPEFIAALGDKISDVRKAAASALGKIGDKRAVEPLIVALEDYSCTSAIEPLIAVFGERVFRGRDSCVRIAAAWALGEIGDERAVEPLISALGDKISDVREAAASALGKIGDKAIPALVFHLQDWYTGNHVANVLDAFGWQPITDEEKVHYLVAKRKVDELKQMWNITKQVLLKDVESNDYRVIKNVVYALLSMGKIGELIDILNRKGTKTMAEIYLNSRNPILFNAVEAWASWHGYKIVGLFDIFGGEITRWELVPLKSK
jgi:hypothetical protein